MFISYVKQSNFFVECDGYTMSIGVEASGEPLIEGGADLSSAQLNLFSCVRHDASAAHLSDIVSGQVFEAGPFDVRSYPTLVTDTYAFKISCFSGSLLILPRRVAVDVLKSIAKEGGIDFLAIAGGLRLRDSTADGARAIESIGASPTEAAFVAGSIGPRATGLFDAYPPSGSQEFAHPFEVSLAEFSWSLARFNARVRNVHLRVGMKFLTGRGDRDLLSGVDVI